MSEDEGLCSSCSLDPQNCQRRNVAGNRRAPKRLRAQRKAHGGGLHLKLRRINKRPITTTTSASMNFYECAVIRISPFRFMLRCHLGADANPKDLGSLPQRIDGAATNRKRRKRGFIE